MKKTIVWVLLALVWGVAASVQGAAAQWWDAKPLGEDLGSVGIQLGMMSPTTTFSDGSSFDSGIAVGLSGSLWPTRYVGARTRIVRSQHSGQHGEVFSPVGAEDPTIWLYNLELAVRYPMQANSFGWFPYVGLGMGGKAFQFSTGRRGANAWGRVMSGGVELRPANSSGFLGISGVDIGVQQYKNTYAFMPNKMVRPDGQHREHEFLGIPGGNDQSDLVVSVGFTLNF